MIIFAIILFLLIIIAPLFRKKWKLAQITFYKTNNSKSYIWLVSIMLMIFLGLRGLSVGIDTNAYYSFFEDSKHLNLIDIFDVSVEQGYWLFQFIIGRVFGDFQFLLIITAIIYVGIVSYNIYRYSVNPMFSYILFIIFGFYSFGMSATRQTLAMAIVMIAYNFIVDKKFIKFLIVTLIAASFHISAMIFLPAYLFNYLKISKKTIISLLGFGLLLFFFDDQIQVLMNQYARLEYSQSETGGFRLYLLLLSTIILGLIYLNPFVKQNMNNAFLLYMVLSSVIIMPLVMWNPAVLRLYYYYYYVFMILYVPNILNVIKEKEIRFALILIFLFVGMIRFFGTNIYVNELDRYIFFWE